MKFANGTGIILIKLVCLINNKVLILKICTISNVQIQSQTVSHFETSSRMKRRRNTLFSVRFIETFNFTKEHLTEASLLYQFSFVPRLICYKCINTFSFIICS